MSSVTNIPAAQVPTPAVQISAARTPAEAKAGLLQALSEKPYDFLDLGAGVGGSLDWSATHFGSGPGLGLELNPDKVAKAQAAGKDVIALDLNTLPLIAPVVDYCTIIHVLEHIPSTPLVRAIMRKAIGLARDFVYIRQPFFDADGYLFRKGYKLYWSDWHGHPNHMTSLEFHNILRPFLAEGHAAGAVIGAKNPIVNSRSSSVLPIHAPLDQHDYKASVHGPKTTSGRRFSEPVYAETVVFIACNADAFDRIDSLDLDAILFDSRKPVPTRRSSILKR